MSQTLSKELHAFNGDPELKQYILNRVLAHQKADEIIKDEYWENGKGCAVGCITHSRNHKEFEKLGIPEWFGRLIDIIFMGLERENAKSFPYQIISAIPVGFSDWQNIHNDFKYYIFDKIYVYNTSVKDTTKKLHKREIDKKLWSALPSPAHFAVNLAVSSTVESTHLAVYKKISKKLIRLFEVGN